MNYLKVGHRPRYVLCALNGLGSIWTDFKPQIEGFDSLGYGRSIKLSEDTTKDLLKVYSDTANHLMKTLQVSKYSYLGWSFGGAAGIMLAALNPNLIDKLVIWGMSSFLYQHQVDQFRQMGDVKNWSQEAVNSFKEIYGEDKYAQRVKNWSDDMIDYCYSNQSIADSIVKDIKCPTLILHGAKDPIADPLHAPSLHKKIINSRLHVYPEGKHNVHISYAEDFNRRVQDFLLEP